MTMNDKNLKKDLELIVAHLLGKPISPGDLQKAVERVAVDAERSRRSHAARDRSAAARDRSRRRLVGRCAGQRARQRALVARAAEDE